MDFQTAMETFAEAWVAANTKLELNLNTQSEPLELTTREKCERGDESNANSPRPPFSPPSSSFEDGRTLTIHCIVESLLCLSGEASESGTPSLESDSFVVVPLATTIQDLVPLALGRLGYTREYAMTAKGSVVLKNWRPLTFDKIAASPLMSVGEILGELSSVATLRILIYSSKTINVLQSMADDCPSKEPHNYTINSLWNELEHAAEAHTQRLEPTRPNVIADWKEKLLRVLLMQNRSILKTTGCPLEEDLVQSLMHSNGANVLELSEELQRKFEAWWSVQQLRMVRPHPSWYSPPPPNPTKHHDPPIHPALQMAQNQHPTPKTRMRTSFDPELELPKLQQWFLANQHPSRQQIQEFVKELNSLESRRGRKLLDVNNVVYWFKNARAAQKRSNPDPKPYPPSVHYKIMLNGYNSNSQSPSEAGAAKSPSSLNQDSAETMEPLLSPQTSPHPEKSPQQSSDPNNDGSGMDEAGEAHSQVQDSISDSTNNNNTTDKDDQMEMSPDDEDDDEEDFDKDYKSLVKSEAGCGSGEQRAPNFPIVPNNLYSQSIMYMTHHQYFSQMNNPQATPTGLSNLADERRKRNRTFIDPVSEVPRLEQWFAHNTHPSHTLILKYTEELNKMPYRQKFPSLEPKNVQFWFKNRRAKCKRLKMSLFEHSANNYLQPTYGHHISTSLAGETYQAH